VTRLRGGTPRPARAFFAATALAVAAAATAVGAAGQETTPVSAAEPLGVARALPPPAGTPLSGAELDAATDELGSRLRCPVCQGLSVSDSPSESAHSMRQQIRELLAEGYTPDQIVEYFERSYGEFVRLVPKARGFNLLVFVLPAAAVAAGILVVIGALRRRGSSGRTGGAPTEADAENLDEYRERVRRELSA
jgi:cytochrome c-type biogenesis protein CcmH